MKVIEAIECCPHCDHENVYLDIDPVACGYIQKCQKCGKEIFLCDECKNADDNPDMNCDWHLCVIDDKVVATECFRGRIVKAVWE